MEDTLKIKINRSPYEEDQNIFPKDHMTLRSNRVYCFVGCNGSGKTTLLYNIIRSLKKTYNAKVINPDFYSNAFRKILRGDPEKATKTFILSFDKTSEVTLRENDYFINRAQLSMLSLGEGIVNRFGKLISLVGSLVSAMHDCRLIITFDDCDAGTSIDMIRDIKEVFTFISDDCKKKNIDYYILLTSNSYEMARDYQCVSVQTFKKLRFKSYESYKKFVLDSRTLKEEREDSNGKEES